MLKKIIFTVFTFFIASSCFAQERAAVEVSGKDKGYVSTVYQNGETFVSVPEIAKILKLQSSWFGRSGQLNVRGKDGFFCVLRDGSTSVPVNGKEQTLTSAAFAKGSVLYAPISFFAVGGAGAAAGGMDVSFEQGKIIVEKPFTIELLSKDFKDDGDKLSFNTKGIVKREVNSKDKERIDVFFPDAVVKREESFDGKTKYIKYFKITQHYNGVKMTMLLTKDAAFWDFYNDGQKLVLAVSKTKIEKPVPAAPVAVSAVPIAPVEEQKASSLPAPSVTSATVTAQEVIAGDDFFSGLPVTEQDTSIESGEPVTVIKALPSSVVSIDKRPSKKLRKARVLIDPGHGGKDTGATRKGVLEKDINLKVAKRLYDLLLKEKNFDVRLSRNDDTFIPLGDRPVLANDFNADIFVSIHSNAARRTSANGFEVYFRSDKASDAEAAETAALENEALKYDGQEHSKVSFADLLLKSLATNENINESSKLAGHIRNSVADRSNSVGIKVYNNSIKQANFYVLRGVQIPAVLVEMGYLSNTDDRKKLNSSSVQNKLADYIKDGILSYAAAEGWN